MDPLSILASAVTLSSALATGLEQLRVIHSADRELQAIINEVSDIRVVFNAIEETVEERRGYRQLSHSKFQSLTSVLEAAKTSLTLLDSLVQDRLLRAKKENTEPKIVRLAWLKHRERIKGLLEDLRSTRSNLSALWGAANLSDLSQIHLRIDEFTILQQTHNNHLVQQSERLDSLSEQFAKQRLIDVSDASESKNLARPGDESPGSSHNDYETSSIIHRHLDDNRNSVASARTYSTVRIRAARYRRSACEGWCSCSCHRLNQFRTPQNADLVLGSLFLGFSGLPFQRQRCSERNCRKQSIPTFKVIYHFPQWLVGRMIHFAVSLTYMNGPQFSLSMPRVVESNADVFTFAVQGDLPALKHLFSQGLASPYDVAASNGRTALHYAVNYNHQEMSQFLIDTGADPKLEDKDRASTVTLAWGRMFGGLTQRSTMDAWRCLFDDEEHLESRAFPPLHKIVLGLSSLDLEPQLELSTATIDDQDADGRTALSWAATRGDEKSVTLLLEYSANPNVASVRGQTPLHWASQNPTAQSPQILQALIDAGTDVNCVDYWKRSALIYASCNQDNQECLRILVNGGAQLDIQDCHERTPLGYAAKMGKANGARFLLSVGADPLIPDIWGYLPLFEALQHNHHLTLQYLLHHQHMTAARDVNGMSVLHLAALYGDVETLNMLAFSDVQDLEMDTKDSNDMVALDLFTQRGEDNDELSSAFRGLMRAVSVSTNLPPDGERVNGDGENRYIQEVSEADVFLDAPEFPDLDA